jgi:microcompartment protein CcmK/EutM
MKIGKVTGNVTMTKRAEGLDREKVLLVEIEGNYMAALDRAGAKTGDRVLLVMSHAAGRYSMEAPADAVVVAVVEN